jgi:hypothetical protein
VLARGAFARATLSENRITGNGIGLRVLSGAAGRSVVGRPG